MSTQAKLAVVTGAGRGIGRALAMTFAEQRFSLCLVARSEKELKETASAALSKGAPKVAPVQADLTTAAGRKRVEEGVRSQGGRLDLLVQNAGLFLPSPLDAGPESDENWDAMLAINLTAPFRLLRLLLPFLREAGGGHVIQVASVAGREAFAGYAGYCASKHGLIGLTNVAREELRGKGTKVTAILPGAVDTPAWEGSDLGLDRARMLRPEDVARAALHAWQDAGGAMTEEIVLRPQPGNL